MRNVEWVCQTIWFLGIRAAAGHFGITSRNEKASRIFFETRSKDSSTTTLHHFRSSTTKFSMRRERERKLWMNPLKSIGITRSIGNGQVYVLSDAARARLINFKVFAFPVRSFAIQISNQWLCMYLHIFDVLLRALHFTKNCSFFRIFHPSRDAHFCTSFTTTFREIAAYICVFVGNK